MIRFGKIIGGLVMAGFVLIATGCHEGHDSDRGGYGDGYSDWNRNRNWDGDRDRYGDWNRNRNWDGYRDRYGDWNRND